MQNIRFGCRIELSALAKTIPPSVTYIDEMSVKQTAKWIMDLGKLLQWEYLDTLYIAKLFCKGAIDGSRIVTFENADLKELKVKKLGHRLAILKAVKCLIKIDLRI